MTGWGEPGGGPEGRGEGERGPGSGVGEAGGDSGLRARVSTFLIFLKRSQHQSRSDNQFIMLLMLRHHSRSDNQFIMFLTMVLLVLARTGAHSDAILLLRRTRLLRISFALEHHF